MTRIQIGMFYALALLGYLLPWLVNPGASLSPNAYDVAEWATLHPPTQETLQPIWIAFLLRLILAALAWMLVLDLRGESALIRVVIALFFFIGLLPPLEYVTVGQSNPNYQQQMFIAAITLAGSAGLSVLPSLIQILLLRLLGGVIIACAIAGFYFAQQLMIGFSMPVQAGIGVFLLVSSIVAIVLLPRRDAGQIPSSGLHDKTVRTL